MYICTPIRLCCSFLCCALLFSLLVKLPLPATSLLSESISSSPPFWLLRRVFLLSLFRSDKRIHTNIHTYTIVFFWGEGFPKKRAKQNTHICTYILPGIFCVLIGKTNARNQRKMCLFSHVLPSLSFPHDPTVITHDAPLGSHCHMYVYRVKSLSTDNQVDAKLDVIDLQTGMLANFVANGSFCKTKKTQSTPLFLASICALTVECVR